MRGYLRDPQLQRNVHRSRNRIEEYYGRKELIGHQCGRPVANIVIAYNSILLSVLLNRYQTDGKQKALALLKRISPIAWQHIYFWGHYAFRDKQNPIDLEAILASVKLI